MPYLGSWKINDYLTFPANTHRADSGAASDADSVPTYRVYEDETASPLLSGSMAILDDANTTGFYTEQIQLTAGSGFEKGKCYTIYIQGTVNTVTGTMSHTFQIEAEVDSNTVSDKTGYGLVDGTITSGTFDNSTAFPLSSIDTGSTRVARTGADSDTLETISDQIDGLPGTGDIADAVWDESATGHISAGTFGRILSEIQHHSYMQREIVKPSGEVLDQGITVEMVNAGDCIQYEECSVSFTRNFETPDITFYILYHYDTDGDCDVKRADTDNTW
jgi:hypothetical protein